MLNGSSSMPKAKGSVMSFMCWCILVVVDDDAVDGFVGRKIED
jgi:hypothetical protein